MINGVEVKIIKARNIQRKYEIAIINKTRMKKAGAKNWNKGPEYQKIL